MAYLGNEEMTQWVQRGSRVPCGASEALVALDLHGRVHWALYKYVPSIHFLCPFSSRHLG